MKKIKVSRRAKIKEMAEIVAKAEEEMAILEGLHKGAKFILENTQ